MMFAGILDRILGRGEWAITVPVMDGPMKPNDQLEQCAVAAVQDKADNLVACDGTVLVSSGTSLLQANLAAGALDFKQVAGFDAEISCLALSPGGARAVGVQGEGIRILDGRHKRANLSAKHFGHASAAIFVDEDTLVVACASASFPPARWQHDLMSLGSSGSVHRVDLATGAEIRLGDGLAFPAGLALSSSGDVLVSEAWRHRILEIPLSGESSRVVLDHLPAYPGRISSARDGGYWIAMFAVRNQLVEFVLRERGYCEEMMRTIEPENWIAPALASGRNYHEVLQGGAVKQMGVLKPWAPTRSYGLLTRCDSGMRIIGSHHSRADGRMHGLTSVIDTGAGVFASAKGGNAILAIEEDRP